MKDRLPADTAVIMDEVDVMTDEVWWGTPYLGGRQKKTFVHRFRELEEYQWCVATTGTTSNATLTMLDPCTKVEWALLNYKAVCKCGTLEKFVDSYADDDERHEKIIERIKQSIIDDKPVIVLTSVWDENARNNHWLQDYL